MATCTGRVGAGVAPQPFGQPGWVRVDTVHQGDLDGIKGLYHVNLVDEVTQFQFIGSVEHIHAACLGPVLEGLLQAFPFTLHGFHTDNGSEFVNREVAALLETLRIEFTRSRARRSTDNALVESKNGSVLRKHLGHGHIPGRWARQVNAFTQQALSPYLNFHRPCFFPREQVDARGRVRKRYRHADVMTPYEKLESLPDADACLKPGTTFAQLDAAAAARSDNEAARALNQARSRTVRAVLVECAHGAARTRHCQFQKYHKALTVRRGYKRAVVATAHKILRCIFAVLRDGTPYRDPATDYEELLVKRNAPRWLRKLREFGILVHNDDGAVSVCWPPPGRTIPVR